MKNLKELYSSRGFEIFTESKLGNDLFINDPERAERIHKAAEDGCDGSTHAEIIGDWREYLNQLDISDEYRNGDLTQDEFDSIEAEIDACEKYHEEKGTIWEEIG